MTFHKPSTVRSAALSNSALNLAKACSIGWKLVQRHVRPQRHLGRKWRVMVHSERLPVALRALNLPVALRRPSAL